MIKKVIIDTFTFVKSHKRFTLFITAAFLLNLFLLLHKKDEKTEFISCSTYDKGVLGTYGLYKDLEDRGVPVKRIKLPIFKEINAESDIGKTLVIISPLFKPNIWEWDMIMDWVAEGNRLITTGFFGPKKARWLPQFDYTLGTSQVPVAESKVLLPVDTVFPYNEPLSKLTLIQKVPIFGQYYRSGDSVRIRHFKKFSPDALPFLSHDNKPTAIKKVIGKGEWIVFTETNPFSNSVLREPSWYRFATRLFTGDAEYENRTIMFDELHNGYKATKSLWQLLMYYKFDNGIIYLCALILFYLFLTGIRIIPPLPERSRLHRDAIPGMRALSALLLKYGAWTGLLKREADYIRFEVLGTRKHAEGDQEQIAQRYLSKKALPAGIASKDELVTLFQKVENSDKKPDKKESVKIFNTFMHMRKEVRS